MYLLSKKMKRIKRVLIFICLVSIFNILLNYSLSIKSYSNFSIANEYKSKGNISKYLNTVYKNLKDQRDFFKDQIEAILTYYNKNGTMINRKEFLRKIEAFSAGFNERSEYVYK
jgi:hypothetical protein